MRGYGRQVVVEWFEPPTGTYHRIPGWVDLVIANEFASVLRQEGFDTAQAVDLAPLTNEELREVVGYPCDHHNVSSEVVFSEDWLRSMIVTECRDCGCVFWRAQ